MKTIDEQTILELIEQQETFAVYIYTPTCGTCQLARRMLSVVEALDIPPLYEINGNLNKRYLQNNKIQSVPALCLYKQGLLVETVFAFGDVINLKNKFSQLK